MNLMRRNWNPDISTVFMVWGLMLVLAGLLTWAIDRSPIRYSGYSRYSMPLLIVGALFLVVGVSYFIAKRKRAR